MLEKNKGDTQVKGLSLQLDQEEANKYRESMIRLLDRIEILESDQVQRDDIKTIYRLLDYFSKDS
ncbi:MAG: hypothetical protein Q8M62_03800 [Algoriphagus sp.]|uniref:hypothetical protein n=1 Tax=Algoriphagus sp. TaxID=1872435 RepID=UPI002733F3E6|nr:hypothetical protein [Algoriphagus sp.]MDP3198926.1 hypothetical protein [Algoriphagus sp.]